MNISIVIPGIRTHLWENVCKTLKKSIGKYDWEVIFVGPFDPPKEINQYPYKFIKSYSTVTVCVQKGLIEAEKDLVFETVDDCLFFDNSIEKCMDDWIVSDLTKKDVVNMRYSEGQNYSGPIQGSENWVVRNFPEFWLPYIDRNWNITCQPLMTREYCIELGGMDCRFIYSNHAIHDKMFRLQQDSGHIYHSRIGVSKADWCPGTKEHKPIEYVQNTLDLPVFNALWSQPRPSKIDINNYIPYDKPWKQRFGQEYTSYEEMAKGEGYVL